VTEGDTETDAEAEDEDEEEVAVEDKETTEGEDNELLFGICSEEIRGILGCDFDLTWMRLVVFVDDSEERFFTKPSRATRSASSA
jgi:hypothetical protein